MTSRIVILLASLLFAMSMVGESLAGPVPSQLPGMSTDNDTRLTPVAFKKKRKHPGQMRNNTTPDKPPHTKPDKPSNVPKDNTSSQQKRPKHRVAVNVARKPVVMCIDGRSTGQGCRCANGVAAKRIARGVLRCLPPQVVRKLKVPDDQVNSSTTAATPPNTAASETSPAQNPVLQAVPDEILATINLATPAAVEVTIAQRYGLQRLEAWPINLVSQRVIRYKVPDGRSISAVVAAMQGDRQIVASQPNYLYGHQAKAGNAKQVSLQYALAKLEIPAAHALTRGHGAILAIVDSGIDRAHPDLAGSVSEGFAAAGDAVAVPEDPHGTEVAGIVAAHGTVKGVAPDARLLDVRVFDYDAGGAEKYATSLALLRGLDWAAGKNAAIVNMSLSGPADALLQEAIEALVRNGVVVVAAAGNGGKLAPAAYPAAYDDVIAVTATDSSDRLYVRANHGTYIDVAAPGVDVLSASLENAYSMTSGTSFAAAHASGVVALMLSNKPGMTPAEVRHALEAGASDLGEPGIDTEFGSGLVNALNALRQ